MKLATSVNDTMTGTNRAYRRLFSTDDGERVLAHLIQTYGAFTSSSYVEGSSDRTMYRLGQADVIKDLLRRLSVTPKALKGYMRLAHDHTGFHPSNDQG